ncbi:hypothetical protein TUBRATIS_007340 [Tubulinosema ratisbonensis]|uniref:Small nuclear ribonucleoprotein Sm D2 n=1 Tax=Tubulinosema ratisbonensis TaxID=291195 RepID=A0A437ANE0_9MICR|nr:hypothetical protein TUBRATIS_007340 [Tubulinosema ratisbonensis]
MFLEKYPENSSKKEIKEYKSKILKEGPFKLLYKAKTEHLKIVIGLKNNHKIYANLKEYDRHFNFILLDALEIFKRKGKGKQVTHRKLGDIYLRGDNVVLIALV